MSAPAVSLTVTGTNDHIWTGPLREFLRVNEFTRIERHEIVNALRSNTVRFGGGAAPAFTVALAKVPS